MRRLFVATGVAALVLLAAPWAPLAEAQSPPDIQHDALRCVPRSDFAELSAVVAPPDFIRTCRIYFRSNVFPDFYYVEMARAGDVFSAYIPRPNELTDRVEYYVECLDNAFANARTLALEAEVVDNASECRRRNPAAAFFPGGDPGILVGAVSPGAPVLPAGFLLDGLVAVGGGGGVSGGTVALGAGAAAGAVLGVAVLSDDSEPEPDGPQVLGPPGPPPDTPPGPPPPPPPPPPSVTVQACFETVPANGIILAGEQLTLDARCSTPADVTYEWQLGDGRMRQGPFVRPTYDVPGTYDVRLAVRSLSDPSQQDVETRSIDVRRRLADLSIEKTALELCEDSHRSFRFTLTVDNRGPRTAENVVATDILPDELVVAAADPACSVIGQTVTCTLGDLVSGAVESLQILAKFDEDDDDERVGTIANVASVSSDTDDPVLGNNESVVLVTSSRFCGDFESRVSTTRAMSLSSRLDLPGEPGTAGRIVVNDRQTVFVASNAPSRHRIAAVSGLNRFEAALTGSAADEGRWTFDFTGSEGLVGGRIQVETGEVLTVTPLSVTFRVRPGANGRIRFSVELRR